MPLKLYSNVLQRAESGVVKILSGASCAIYGTMADGTAPVDASGTLQVGAALLNIYSDRAGVTAASNPVISDSQGYIEFYPKTSEFHILVTLSDGTVFGIPWVNNPEGGFVNVQNYPTFQIAFDQLPTDGTGTLFIPAPVGAGGVYNHAGSGGLLPKFAGSGSTPALIVNKPCVIRGEGSSRVTLRDFGTGAKDRDAILITVSGVTLEGFAVAGTVGAGSGNLIHWYKAATGLNNLVLRDIRLLDAMAWGLRAHVDNGFFLSKIFAERMAFGGLALTGAQGGSVDGSGDVFLGDGNGAVDNCRFTDCEFIGPGYGTHGGLAKGAVHLFKASNIRFDKCSWQGNDDCACVSIEGTGGQGQGALVFRDSYIERLNTVNTPVHAFTISGEVQVLIIDALAYYQQEPSTGPKLLRTTAGAILYGCYVANTHIRAAQNPIAGTDTIQLGASTQRVILHNCYEYGVTVGDKKDVAVTGSAIEQVTSASTTTLPNSNQCAVFQLTGGVTVNILTVSWAGRIVFLTTNTNTTINDDGTAAGNIKTNAGANINLTADDVICLLCTGSGWLQVAPQSVN